MAEQTTAVREVRVETDDVQFCAERVNPVDCAAQRCRSDPASATGGGRGRSRLGVDQLARHNRIGAIPQLGGQFGSRFIEDQLDQR